MRLQKLLYPISTGHSRPTLHCETRPERHSSPISRQWCGSLGSGHSARVALEGSAQQKSSREQRTTARACLIFADALWSAGSNRQYGRKKVFENYEVNPFWKLAAGDAAVLVMEHKHLSALIV